MSPHRKPNYPPPPEGTPERRKMLRRESDCEEHEIAETVVTGAWAVVHDARTKWRGAFFGAVMGMIISLPAQSIGMRIWGPKQEIEVTNKQVTANTANITAMKVTLDSLTRVFTAMQQDVATARRLGCLNSSRQVASAAGC